MELYNLVKAKQIKNSLVFISSGTGHLKPMAWHNLTRNDIDFSNSVLYAKDKGEDNHLLMEFYPEKSYYRFSQNKNTGEGELKELYLTSRPGKKTD